LIFGDTLLISEPTVKTHLRNINSKTDIHDRPNLAISSLEFASFSSRKKKLDFFWSYFTPYKNIFVYSADT